MSNTNTENQKFTRTEINLDEPHFDEEATLLAAQPVVPLEEVKAHTRSNARMGLGLAIVGGLLIGLVAAFVVFRYAGANRPADVETTSAAVPESLQEPQAAAGGLADNTSADSVTVNEENTEVADNESSNQTETPKSAPATSNAPRSRPVIVADRSEPEDDEYMDREMRRAEKKAERQARRHAARQERRERAQTPDDLMRIREIFEGMPRP